MTPFMATLTIPAVAIIPALFKACITMKAIMIPITPIAISMNDKIIDAIHAQLLLSSKPYTITIDEIAIDIRAASIVIGTIVKGFRLPVIDIISTFNEPKDRNTSAMPITSRITVRPVGLSKCAIYHRSILLSYF